MISVLGLKHRDMRDISALLEGPWRVTAELSEMVQYVEIRDSIHYSDGSLTLA